MKTSILTSKDKWYKVYDQVYTTIRSFIKDNPDEFDFEGEIEYETYENLASLLYENSLVDFTICSRTDRDGSDYWTQCEYYSEKLKKTIIWDYDFQDYAKDLYSFAEQIAKTQADIYMFEKGIKL